MPSRTHAHFVPPTTDHRQFDAAHISENELAVLELLLRNPIGFFPPLIVQFVMRLESKGLAIFRDDSWHVTRRGIAAAGRTLH
ncbi:MAG: hypothetical protein KDJ37_06355 [Hyphomicrobiaceae bacterium]|nr:hypothetical protein [Hyphomicrobiaceae bacterium]